jgi:hypothetical protein
MKEIELQTDIINAVRQHGGAAHKLSHRFSVGVVDLLAKPPYEPARLIEVKLNERPARLDTPITLDITRPQVEFLQDYYNSGMIAGVLSLVFDRKKGKRLMWGRTFPVVNIDMERTCAFTDRMWTEIQTENRSEMLRALVWGMHR